MKIHHYTSIDALESILANRTIRFNRTDRVDDKDEVEVDINGIAFSKYLFVSCWTMDDCESIPQWSMYGNHSRGVRITLDSDHIFNDFFSSMKVKLDSKFDLEVEKRLTFQLNGEKIFPVAFIHKEKEVAYFPHYLFHGSLEPKTCGLAIIPPSPSYDILNKVEYVDTLNNVYSDQIQIQKTVSGKYNMQFSTRIGYKKHISWAFQKEARYIIMLMFTYPERRIDNTIWDMPNINFSKAGFAPIDEFGHELLFYDIKVDNDTFDYLEIVAGPETVSNDIFRIQKILETYAPNAILKRSMCRTNFNREI